jgi:hypothetical protein
MRLDLRWFVPLLSLGGLPRILESQQYRLRLDSQFQSVSFRGVSLDSVLASATVPASSGGRETADGFTVRCGIGETYCFFFRPGTNRSARPAVTSAAATIWGLGLPGLSLRVDARLAVDLGDSEIWPGTSPAFQLLEGYAEYSVERYTGRLGRQVYTSRLGFAGFDGARATVRFAGGRLEADGYLGWGLGRGSALPVTSEALNPLDDFQPRQRQLIAGAALGWRYRLGTLRIDYQREVDPRSDYFVSERAAGAASVRLPARLSLDLGAEYDIAMGQWGSSDATLRYSRRTVAVSAGFIRYRPHFELWTIWGAFSPVGYSAVNGTAVFTPIAGLSVRAKGSRFWFEETATETPLVTVEDRGWRITVGASYSPTATMMLSADHATEFGPGGSYTSLTGTATYMPRPSLTLALHGGRLNRPLEFRFDEATLHLVGVDAEWRFSERWRGTVSATRLIEKRDRPDAGAFDWNQTRLVARLSVLLGWEPDQLPLPPGARSPTVETSR